MSDIETFVARDDGEIVAVYTDVLSGADNTRPELAKAMAHARKLKGTVIVSRLDRLSRDAGFIQDLMDGGTKFVVVALGKDADPMMIAMYAQMAQKERQMISERIKGALKAAKARGTVIGSPHAIERAAAGREVWSAEAQERAAPVLELIEMFQRQGTTTLKGIAAELTKHGIATPSKRKNGIRQHERMAWTATQVSRVLARAA